MQGKRLGTLPVLIQEIAVPNLQVCSVLEKGMQTAGVSLCAVGVAPVKWAPIEPR